MEMIVFMCMSKGSNKTRWLENALAESPGHFDNKDKTIKQICADLRALVREGREWKIRTTWMETGEQWVRNLLKTRGQVPGLDQFIQCPDPKKFDDCIDLLEPLITTMESEVMKMHRNVDKSTKRKYANAAS